MLIVWTRQTDLVKSSGRVISEMMLKKATWPAFFCFSLENNLLEENELTNRRR